MINAFVKRASGVHAHGQFRSLFVEDEIVRSTSDRFRVCYFSAVL